VLRHLAAAQAQEFLPALWGVAVRLLAHEAMSRALAGVAPLGKAVEGLGAFLGAEASWG
jgi:hypothetical protein